MFFSIWKEISFNEMNIIMGRITEAISFKNGRATKIISRFSIIHALTISN